MPSSYYIPAGLGVVDWSNVFTSYSVEETPYEYKVGDKIEMTSEADDMYYVTKEGSIGVIKRIDSDREGEEYYVEFNSVTGDAFHSESHYWVSAEYFKLAGPELSSKEKVIKKINTIQQRRKEQGYAF